MQGSEGLKETFLMACMLGIPLAFLNLCFRTWICDQQICSALHKPHNQSRIPYLPHATGRASMALFHR